MLTASAPRITYVGPFSKPWEDSDVTIIVEKQKLHVHSLFLTMASPVFKKMLSCGMKESQTREIELAEKKLANVELMLKAIYAQHQASLIGKLNLNQLKTLLALSNEYIIDSLKTFVISQVGSMLDANGDYWKTILPILEFSDKSGFKELIKKCSRKIAASSRDLSVSYQTSLKHINLSYFKELSNSTKMKLCVDILKAKYVDYGMNLDLRDIIIYMSNIEL